MPSELFVLYKFEGPEDGNDTRTQRPKTLKCAHLAQLQAEVELGKCSMNFKSGLSHIVTEQSLTSVTVSSSVKWSKPSGVSIRPSL